MMKKLFTERHGEGKARVADMLDDATREGLLTLVSARIDEEWFGLSFNEKCSDGFAYAGTDLTRLGRTMTGYGIIWPHDVDRNNPPNDGQIFDLLEFSYEFIAEAKDPHYHSYMSHSHYSYDREAGREKFTQDVNRMFERNGIAFELRDGEIVRLAPAVLQEALAGTTFRTGDPLLDEILESARHKILNRSIDVRRESLEKLWDAWERLKTLEPGRDKGESAGRLLDKAAAEPTFRARLEEEARALTSIGNTFMIRHTETDKIPVADSAHIDYLFHRMFSMIRLLLKSSGRSG
jgi:AbiJ N-terminal domain 4